MNGAREYCKVFTRQEQVGRLFIWPSDHARGKTLGMWVVPEGYEVIQNGYPKFTSECVKVYDAVSGQRGWTETYGWVHRGKWVEDFDELYKQRLEQQQVYQQKVLEDKADRIAREKQATEKLLQSY